MSREIIARGSDGRLDELPAHKVAMQVGCNWFSPLMPSNFRSESEPEVRSAGKIGLLYDAERTLTQWFCIAVKRRTVILDIGYKVLSGLGRCGYVGPTCSFTRLRLSLAMFPMGLRLKYKKVGFRLSRCCRISRCMVTHRNRRNR